MIKINNPIKMKTKQIKPKRTIHPLWRYLNGKEAK